MNDFKNPIVIEDLTNIISSIDDWNYFSGKTVLVTGANGFIPSYIIYTFLRLNDENLLNVPIKIIGLVRNEKKSKKKFGDILNRDDFELLISDVSDFKLNTKVDIIIHAASQASPKYYGIDPVGTLKANTIGTYNILNQAVEKQVEKFLFISSGEVYGILDGTIPSIEETYTGNVDITDVRSCYAESKRMGENMCVCFSHQFDIHTNMIRLSHTYGPGISLDDGRVFADFTKCVVNNENIVLNSDGSAKRSFVYISDMIIGLFKVLLNAPSCEAYNISADFETQILELANIICGLYPDKKLKVEFKENNNKNYIKSKSSSAKLSNNKLKKIGWKQKIFVNEGFKRMIESYL